VPGRRGFRAAVGAIATASLRTWIVNIDPAQAVRRETASAVALLWNVGCSRFPRRT
jgi:hypothetical protein